MNMFAAMRNLLRWDRAMSGCSVSTAACLLAVWMHYQYRLPGPVVLVLFPAVGLVLAALSGALLFIHLFRRLPADDPFRLTLNRIQWGSGLLIRLFVYSSLVLYVNGILDQSRPVFRPADVLSIQEAKDVGLPVPYRWLTVRYRDDPKDTEQILLKGAERDRLWGAEPVSVTLQSGLLGLQWVAAIERDWDWYGREILKVAPTASVVWKQVIDFDLKHHRWQEGIAMAWEYLRQYPRDAQEAQDAGVFLFLGEHAAEAIPFFQYALDHHSTPEQRQLARELIEQVRPYAGVTAQASPSTETSPPR